MTKKKGIASKLFIGLTGLTLLSCCFLGTTFARYTSLSCCFLGTTFARYTSGGSGTAEVGVALWDVDFSGTGGTDSTGWETEMGDLSPAQESKDGWTEGGSRTHSTEKKLIGVVTNNSDVDASVTISLNSETPVFHNAKGIQMNEDVFGTGIASNGVDAGASMTEVQNLFSITVYYSTTNSAEAATKEFKDAQRLSAKTGDSTNSLYVFAVVTWTSSDNIQNDDDGTLADAIDTWVGENVASLSYSFTLTAVQASELPTA